MKNKIKYASLWLRLLRAKSILRNVIHSILWLMTYIFLSKFEYVAFELLFTKNYFNNLDSILRTHTDIKNKMIIYHLTLRREYRQTMSIFCLMNKANFSKKFSLIRHYANIYFLQNCKNIVFWIDFFDVSDIYANIILQRYVFDALKWKIFLKVKGCEVENKPNFLFCFSRLYYQFALIKVI